MSVTVRTIARRLKQGLILLAMGALITVGVAWLGDQELPRFCTVMRARPTPWPRGAPGNWPLPEHYTLTQYTWGEVREWSVSGRRSQYEATEHVSGFPCRALARRTWRSEIEKEPEEAALPSPGALMEENLEEALAAIKKKRKTPEPPVREEGSHGALALKVKGPGSRTALPIGVIWPGFAINCVLYAALLLVSTRLGRAWIEARRRENGWCIACGYACQGLAMCPECGGPALPAAPIARWRLATATTCGALAVVVLVVYVFSLAGGMCFKQSTSRGGWYAGVWRGEAGFAVTTYRFIKPGLEAATYDIPFRFDLAIERTPEQVEYRVPLWIPLGALAIGALAARGILGWPTSRHNATSTRSTTADVAGCSSTVPPA